MDFTIATYLLALSCYRMSRFSWKAGKYFCHPEALGVTILSSTTEIQIVLSSQCNVGAPVWSVKASIYLRITLVFLIDLYMHLISPSLESYAIAG